jgi:hypothetical protein
MVVVVVPIDMVAAASDWIPPRGEEKGIDEGDIEGKSREGGGENNGSRERMKVIRIEEGRRREGERL